VKPTFNNLSEGKKQRIINSCVEEFGEHGYDSSSLNGIIKRAGISKGGLYEYISSKEELFIFTVDYAYSSLFQYLKKRIATKIDNSPNELMDRLKLVSELAIDFYISYPEFVYLIVRTSNLANNKVAIGIQDIFRNRFLELFENTETSGLKYPKEQIQELAMWLFLKTQFDFLNEIKTEKDPVIIKKDYMKTWQFYLGMMKNGIFSLKNYKIKK
jgi:AcrR family transcriptional regulator